VSKIQEKINNLMDEIQILIEANAHQDGDLEKLKELLSRISIYWEHMDDEKVDYIQAVQNAIEHKKDWIKLERDI
tara:strand:+ start:159 stop:383 length:225 start_codon:yes stop_codon:yes gene_type:complete